MRQGKKRAEMLSTSTRSSSTCWREGEVCVEDETVLMSSRPH